MTVNNGNRVGPTGAVLEYAVKKYMSHRRLSPSINPYTIYRGVVYEEKESQLTFKRCK